MSESTVDEQPREETDLIIRAIAGDKDAFGRLYDQYFAMIFRYLRFRCRNIQDAEDMTENVFIRAWEYLPTFKLRRGVNGFRAWLFRIAHNLRVDQIRKTNKDELVDTVPENIGSSSRVEVELMRTDTQKHILRAIRSLDERAQQVVIARFVSELTHKETAHMLNISPGNVRIIQYRALRELKKFLERNEFDE